MNLSDIVSDSAVIILNDVQREVLADLLETEREHALRWWTFLNEMRCRGELPDWVKQQGIGSHSTYERMDRDRIAFNSALFGKRVHIRIKGEPVLVSKLFDVNLKQTGQ